MLCCVFLGLKKAASSSVGGGLGSDMLRMNYSAIHNGGGNVIGTSESISTMIGLGGMGTMGINGGGKDNPGKFWPILLNSQLHHICIIHLMRQIFATTGQLLFKAGYMSRLKVLSPSKDFDPGLNFNVNFPFSFILSPSNHHPPLFSHPSAQG